jgi:hypothetical protein
MHVCGKAAAFPHASVRGGRNLGGLVDDALIPIWMSMSPSPVGSLLSRVYHVELTILGVPFAEVYAVGTVFAVIPHVVVTTVAIVITVMFFSKTNHRPKK